MHLHLKHKIRAALIDILVDPACGKPLKEELSGYWSLRVGRLRVIYRPDQQGVEIVALGPRNTIYDMQMQPASYCVTADSLDAHDK